MNTFAFNGDNGIFAVYNTFFFIIIAVFLFLVDETNKAPDNRFISVIGRILIPA